MAIDNIALRPSVITGSYGMLALPAFFLMSSSALAAVIVDNGTTLDIDSTHTSIDYVVRNNSTLNMTGATTQNVLVLSGSTLNINGATIVANPGQAGIMINGSQATIDRASVTSDGIALLVNRPVGSTESSTVTAANSELSGGTAGAAVTGFSSLELINTIVTGTGTGSFGLIVAGEALVQLPALVSVATPQVSALKLIHPWGVHRWCWTAQA
jgi:hypothetical protein